MDIQSYYNGLFNSDSKTKSHLETRSKSDHISNDRNSLFTCKNGYTTKPVSNLVKCTSYHIDFRPVPSKRSKCHHRLQYDHHRHNDICHFMYDRHRLIYSTTTSTIFLFFILYFSIQILSSNALPSSSFISSTSSYSPHFLPLVSYSPTNWLQTKHLSSSLLPSSSSSSSSSLHSPQPKSSSFASSSSSSSSVKAVSAAFKQQHQGNLNNNNNSNNNNNNNNISSSFNNNGYNNTSVKPSTTSATSNSLVVTSDPNFCKVCRCSKKDGLYCKQPGDLETIPNFRNESQRMHVTEIVIENQSKLKNLTVESLAPYPNLERL